MRLMAGTRGRYVLLVIDITGIVLLLTFAVHCYHEYMSVVGQELAGLLVFAAWLLGGVGLTALGVMAVLLVTHIARGDDSPSIVSVVGSGGLLALTVGWVTWIGALIGLMGLGESESAGEFLVSSFGFSIVVTLQVLLYLKLSAVFFGRERSS